MPGGNIGPRYYLQLLIGKKITKLLKTQQPLKLKKKNKDRFGILLKYFDTCLKTFKNNNFT
jgi:hypothetical protein